MGDTIPQAVLALLEASPWRHAEGGKPSQAHVYCAEATDEGALFTFAQANRLLNERAFHDQAWRIGWPAPPRIKASAQPVRSLDDFLADTYAGWIRHQLRLKAIGKRHGPVQPSPEEQAGDRADWLEASRLLKDGARPRSPPRVVTSCSSTLRMGSRMLCPETNNFQLSKMASPLATSPTKLPSPSPSPSTQRKDNPMTYNPNSGCSIGYASYCSPQRHQPGRTARHHE